MTTGKRSLRNPGSFHIGPWSSLAAMTADGDQFAWRRTVALGRSMMADVVEGTTESDMTLSDTVMVDREFGGPLYRTVASL